MLERKTDIGYIRFSKGVIERIVDDAVSACEGRVFLQNYKGRYKSVIPGGEEINVTELADGVHIDMYVVMRFGSSIKHNTTKIMDYIEEKLQEIMGEKPAAITVVITAVQSKMIARRHVVITREVKVSEAEEKN